MPLPLKAKPIKPQSVRLPQSIMYYTISCLASFARRKKCYAIVIGALRPIHTERPCVCCQARTSEKTFRNVVRHSFSAAKAKEASIPCVDRTPSENDPPYVGRPDNERPTHEKEKTTAKTEYGVSRQWISQFGRSPTIGFA